MLSHCKNHVLADHQPEMKRAAVILVAILALAALLVPLPADSRLDRALMDLVHAPLFALLAAGLYVLLGGSRVGGPISRGASAFLVVTLFGALAELGQALTGRSASWADLAADACGAAAGIALAAAWSSRERAAQVGLVLLGLAGLGLGVYRGSATIADVYRQHAELPRLASFERQRELDRWYPHEAYGWRMGQHATEGDWSLELQLLPGQYPGITLWCPPPDWSIYESLALDVALDQGPPLDLVVKIQDRRHNNDYRDRFNGMFHLQPGKQTLRISLADVQSAPDSRLMRLDEIAALSLFVIDLGVPRKIWIDNIRLESPLP
jgi:VanZ family protein